MGKDKLQVCLSFKHTKEEEALYTYVISQSDKSAFLKNLIRNSMNANQQPIHYIVEESKPIASKSEIAINYGKKTINKFLA